MKEKTYFISAVASKYDIHPQTLRLYEREGLLIPSRSKGNTRMYCDEDLKKLEFILNLTREMGVNLAGIEPGNREQGNLALIFAAVAHCRGAYGIGHIWIIDRADVLARNLTAQFCFKPKRHCCDDVDRCEVAAQQGAPGKSRDPRGNGRRDQRVAQLGHDRHMRQRAPEGVRENEVKRAGQEYHIRL